MQGSLIEIPLCEDEINFESITDVEIMQHWSSVKDRKLSDDDAWDAIVTGIALTWPSAKVNLGGSASTKEVKIEREKAP